MPKFKFKGLYKFLFVFVMFFSCLGVVAGANWYNDIFSSESGLYSKCNSDKNCLPLCVYSDANGNETALIGYFYENGIDKYVWEIDYIDLNVVTILGSEVNPIYFAHDVVIPTQNIYWKGDFRGWNDSGNWQNSDGYKNLDNNFICPGVLYVDQKNNMVQTYNELCFEDEVTGGRCSSNKDNSVDFDVPLSLSYSFVNDNYSTIIDEVVSKLEVHDNDDPDYSLLSIVDNSFKYDEGLLTTEVLFKDKFLTETNCQHFKDSFENTEVYSSKIVTSDTVNKYIKARLNPLIEKTAQSYNVRHPEVYNYETLSVLMNNKGSFRNIGKNGKNFDNLNELFYKRLVDTMKKASKECNVKYNTNINFNVEKAAGDIKAAYDDVLKAQHAKIDFTAQYDCGIFNKEITNMIQTGYFVIELLSIVILIVFSVLDYSKVILNGDMDQMKKSNGNLFKRIIIVVVIFLLPAILNVALKLFKIEGFDSEQPLCVEIKK